MPGVNQEKQTQRYEQRRHLLACLLTSIGAQSGGVTGGMAEGRHRRGRRDTGGVAKGRQGGSKGAREMGKGWQGNGRGVADG